MSTPADLPKPEDHFPEGEASHLTDEMAQAVLDFCMDMCLILGYPMWTISVMVEPAADDCWATIEHVRKKLLAELKLCTGWMELDRSNQYETLVHEMLHLVHYRVDLVIDDLQTLMGVDGAVRVSNDYNREVEYMVEHFTKVISSHVDVEAMWEKHLKNNKVYPTE